MIELQENNKMMKFQKIHAKLEKEFQKKNRPRTWEEIDDLEKQERKVLESDAEEYSFQNRKKKLKKAKNEKIEFRKEIIGKYEAALIRHRAQERSFHRPTENLKLNIDTHAILKKLYDAKNNDFEIPLTLKQVGIKSLKTLYVGGAKKQFQIVINFLKDGTIPAWMFECHEELMNKKPHQFRGTVRSHLKF